MPNVDISMLSQLMVHLSDGYADASYIILIVKKNAPFLSGCIATLQNYKAICSGKPVVTTSVFT